MKKAKLVCGIDVSKETLDVCYNDVDKTLKKRKLANTKVGHLSLLKSLGKKRVYVLEDTGKYSFDLCYTLKKLNVDVRVEHPTVIKRFIQMNMERNKSDSSDAEWICQYGLMQDAKKWDCPPLEQIYGAQILNTIDLLTRVRTSVINNLHSFKPMTLVYSESIIELEKLQGEIEEKIKRLESKLNELLISCHRKLMTNLSSIPGLGKRVIAYLIIKTNGFTKFENHRQLIAYAGLSPKESSSGIHIGKKRISKMGNRYLRKTLYMCAMAAIRFNKPCKEKFDHLKKAGKNGKVALIAVCNQLLKQAFAIAKSGRPFDQNYKSEYQPNVYTVNSKIPLEGNNRVQSDLDSPQSK